MRAAQLVHQPRPLARRADELAALVDRHAVADLPAQHAPADAIARLQHDGRDAALLQLTGCCQSREAAADDGDVRLQSPQLSSPLLRPPES